MELCRSFAFAQAVASWTTNHVRVWARNVVLLPVVDAAKLNADLLRIEDAESVFGLGLSQMSANVLASALYARDFDWAD